MKRDVRNMVRHLRTHKNRLRNSQRRKGVTPPPLPERETKEKETPRQKKQKKARFLTPPTTSNKATLAPKGSPSESIGESLAATRLKKKNISFLSLSGSIQVRAGITPCRETEGLLRN